MILSEVRENALRHAIEAEIRRYARTRDRGETPRRNCAWCGSSFRPVHRYHFLDSESCRRSWYGGQFRPRHDAQAKRRRAA